MDIQFKHHIRDRKSFVLETPNKLAVIEAIQSYITYLDSGLNLFFGETKVHPKDQYSRKTGREIATNKMKRQYFTITQVIVDTHGYYLKLRNGKYEISMCLGKSGVPRFNYIEEV